MATTSHARASQYPLTERLAVDAAEYWLRHAPASLADWRDERFSTFADYLQTPDRKAAFDRAYALRIGQAMVEVRHA